MGPYRQRTALLGLLLLAPALSGCAVIFADLNPFAARPEELEEHVVSGEGRDKIVLIDISRVISAQEREGTLGLTKHESMVARVRQELQQAADDDRVKALVLRINSPGGTVTASDVLHHEVRAFAAHRRTPVIAQLMDLGTSGAYYVALAADEIVAHPTTVTGSIGVVLFGINLEGLLDKIGVRNQTLKAGTHKDIGSPLRKMSPDEERILQTILNDMRDRFVQLVRERRPHASGAPLAAATDGRVITAGQALEAGLIDRIGYLEDALAMARARAGIERARVIMYRRPSEFAETIYSRATTAPPQVNLINLDLAALGLREPAFMYLWQPALEQ